MSTMLRMLTTQWERKCSSIFWAIIFYQYIRWLSQQNFDGSYWMDESLWSAQVSLLIVLLFESLFHVRRWVRFSFSLISILVVHVAFFSESMIWGPIDSFASLRFILSENVMQMMPYGLFGIVTAFMYLTITSWATTKGKVIFLLIFSVIVFSIVDSFSTTLYLWEEVVFILFSGVLLVVIRHFIDFKIRHPASWEQLKEYPGKIVVPILLFLGMIVTVSVFAPHSRPFLTDPYTWWQSMRGEPVISIGKSVGGQNLLSTSAPSTESGYSRDDSELGGGFHYDYSQVMLVNTSHRSYWRGEVRGLYTGKGWESGGLDEFSSSVSAGADTLLEMDEHINTSRLSTIEVHQTVMMVDDLSYPVLFAAYSPNQVVAIDGEKHESLAVTWFDHQQELRWDAEGDEYPNVYEIISQMPLIDEEGLRSANTEMPDSMAAVYLQLPDTVTERVKQLALDITAEGDNPYDKMKLLETYLKTTYAYTNMPDLSHAKGEDFVDDFLFEIQEGYCDYYSTAMVVMARSLGIPARWVKGYTSGTLEQDMYITDFDLEMDLNPNGSGTYVVTNSNAHSWVEIYFDGYGWIPFEPTASFVYPTFLAEDSADPLLPDLSLEPEAYTENVVAPSTPNSPWGIIMVVLIVLVVIVLILWLIVRGKGFSPWRKWTAHKPSEQMRDRMIEEFGRFLRYANRKGFKRDEHETVRETMDKWIEKSAWLQPNLEQLFLVFEKAKYSSVSVSHEDLQQMMALIEQLRKDMK